MIPTAASIQSVDRGIYTLTAVASSTLYVVLLIAPVLAIKLATDLAFSNGEIGALLSIELGAFALATVPSYLWLRRVDIRKAIYVLAVLVIGGNVISGFMTDFGSLAVARALTALSAGSITVIVLAIGGKASNPARAFGVFILAQCIVGAVVLFLFPIVYANLPIGAIYWTMAGLAALLLLFVHVLDGGLLRRADDVANTGQTGRDVKRYVLGLLAVLLLFVAGAGLWSFLGQIAVMAGQSPTSVSLAFSIATIIGIVAPLAVTLLGERRGSWIFIAVGSAVMVVSVVLLFGMTSGIVLIISATLFTLGWNFLPPYLFAAIGRTSGSPYALSTTNLLVGVGFAIGPAVAGQMLEATGSSTPLLLGCMAVLTLAGIAGAFSARGVRDGSAGDASDLDALGVVPRDAA